MENKLQIILSSATDQITMSLDQSIFQQTSHNGGHSNICFALLGVSDGQLCCILSITPQQDYQHCLPLTTIHCGMFTLT